MLLVFFSSHMYIYTRIEFDGQFLIGINGLFPSFAKLYSGALL